MKVFTFDKSKLSDSIINELIDSKQNDLTSYKKLMDQVLPELLGMTHTAIDSVLETAALPQQKIGNCAYANSEGAVLALMLLSKLFQIPSPSGLLGKQKVEQIVTEQKGVFSDWQAYLLLRAMEKDLKWVKDKRNHLVPNFDLVKGAFERFAAINSVPQELKERAGKLRQEWDAVEARILSPTRLDKAYYFFGVPTLIARMQRGKD